MMQPVALPSMPYFTKHRKASISSANTRQRDSFEGSVDPSCAPRLMVTSSDNETDDDERMESPSMVIDTSYPASELPFASEPALETELETELPPLKKLRPTRYNGGISEEDDDIPSEPKIIVTNAVKGILSKKDHTSPVRVGSISPVLAPTTPPSPVIKYLDPNSSPLTALSGSQMTRRSLSCDGPSFTVGESPHSTFQSVRRPVSRRSSTGLSALSSTSTKAVRFATRNAVSPGCEHDNPLESSEDDEHRRCTEGSSFEDGPVAAVMYLTHSAEAYDRTSILVEKSLRMPPRQDPEECGRWVQCGDVRGRSMDSPSPRRKSKCKGKNRADGSGKGKSQDRSSQDDSNELSITRTATTSSDQSLSFVRHGSNNDLQLFRTREQHEDADEQDDVKDEWRTAVEEDDGDSDDGGGESDGDVDSDDGIEADRYSGLRSWSGSNSFGCDDALGGF